MASRGLRHVPNQRPDASSLALHGFCTGQIPTKHVNIYARATIFACPCHPRTTAIASLHVPTDFPLDTNHIFPVSGMTQYAVKSFPHWRHVDPGMSKINVSTFVRWRYIDSVQDRSQLNM